MSESRYSASIFDLIPWPPKTHALRGLRSQRVFLFTKNFYRGLEPLKPVFILGCGRSGTTIIGEIISQHHHVLYLNEPRFIWSEGYPQTDIWSHKARKRGGRLDLDANSCTAAGNRSIRRMFGFALRIYKEEKLVEKLPENAYRIPFLLSIFPDAQFIHIIRHGIEVARSIEKRALLEKWYGWRDYKWDELQRVAMGFPWGKEVVKLCRNGFQRGLLEWRLSLEFAFRHLEILPAGRYLEVRYESLLEKPGEVCQRIQEFLREENDEKMIYFATNNVSRRSLNADVNQLSIEDRQITGDWCDRLGYS